MKIAKAIQIAMFLLATPSMTLQGQTSIYTYTVPSGGYAPDGDLINYSDSVTGQWAMQYDSLNRLQGAGATSGPYSSAVIGWQYDTSGNRQSQSVTGSPSVTVPSAWATYDANNRMTTNQNAVTSGILGYDNAGNMTFDGTNRMVYDAESRLCAVFNSNTGQTTQYLYDAEGHRVAKGHPVSSSNPPVCATGQGDFVADEIYIVGLNGEQVSELDASRKWKHTNVYANGQLLATYDQEGAQQLLHFNITDPLGTKRVQTTASGVVELTYLSLPYGDGLSYNGTGQDATEHHFTGKERDAESGLDYFGARYYASSMGRFLSPDWAAKTEPVPYAKLDNPQSLNLYGYVLNNPLSTVDADGHWPSQIAIGTLWINPLDAAANLKQAAIGFGKALVNTVNYFTGDCSCQSRSIAPLMPSNGAQAFAMMTAPLVAGPVVDVAFGGMVTTTTSAPAAIATESTSISSMIPEVGQEVYRVWGGESGPFGHSWSPMNPDSVSDFRNSAGLPNVNTGTQMTTGTLTDATGVTARPALPLNGNKGGAPEYLVPKPQNQIQIKSIKETSDKPY